MKKFIVMVEAMAFVHRRVEVIAEDKVDAEWQVECLFTKTPFYDLDFNWELPDRCQRVEIATVIEIEEK